MSEIAKGGRGKKAPYESTHYRVPLPLKPIFEQMAADYRELVELVDDPTAPGVIAAVVTATAARLDNQESDVEDQEIQEIKVSDQDIVLNALNKFIELQQAEYGKNSAQRGKEFSTDTRGWDMLKKFTAWVKNNSEQPLVGKLDQPIADVHKQVENIKPGDKVEFISDIRWRDINPESKLTGYFAQKGDWAEVCSYPRPNGHVEIAYHGSGEPFTWYSKYLLKIT